ncbi:Eco57I restriction-modification methylase domain-containing protein [Pseudomonas baetica]|uniref:Eco57I restriction-modification methylase domain-containing protein n=1 Tax=Pseudomonas baetica TaxID=674054 RepID=UPI003EE90F5F
MVRKELARNDMTCLDYSHELGLLYRSKTTKKHKKDHGQFMTPPNIATFMAEKLLEKQNSNFLKILDPAAGTGILISALIEEILKLKKKPLRIEVTAFEIDPSLAPYLKELETLLHKKLSPHTIEYKLTIIFDDFLLSNITDKYDLIITNPPFFKLRKDDPRSISQIDVVHGQPNIYGLFMSKCADTLATEGSACFLTPRSWTSGKYFKKLRAKLNTLNLFSAHLFESRNAPFSNDRIQQESMITWYKKSSTSIQNINLSFSIGEHDIAQRKSRTSSEEEIFADDDFSLTFIKEGKELSIKSLPFTFSSCGLKASTGKVVPFRTKEHIRPVKSENTEPLYWMQHTHQMSIQWPIGMKKEHIICSNDTEKLGIINSNYVLVRRFSPQDASLHVIAAPLLQTAAKMVFIENHLNYIFKKNGLLSAEEVYGIAYYLNSKPVSNYFSERLGHTQINAGDINKLPCPSLGTLQRIGKILITKNNLSNDEKDIFSYIYSDCFPLPPNESQECQKY